jgi:hypothetical protein
LYYLIGNRITDAGTKTIREVDVVFSVLLAQCELNRQRSAVNDFEP